MDDTSARVERIELLKERLRSRRSLLINGAISKYSRAGMLIETTDLNLAREAWSHLVDQDLIDNLKENDPDRPEFLNFEDPLEFFDADREWEASFSSRFQGVKSPLPIFVECHLDSLFKDRQLSEGIDPVEIRLLARDVVTGIMSAIDKKTSGDSNLLDRTLAILHGMDVERWRIRAPISMLQQFSLELGRELAGNSRTIILLPVDDGSPVDNTYFQRLF